MSVLKPAKKPVAALEALGYAVAREGDQVLASHRTTPGPDLYANRAAAWDACRAHYRYGVWPLA